MADPRPDLPTQQLVAAAQDGDAQASGALLQRYLPVLRAFVRLRSDRVLREREAESDLVQTACRQALQNLGQFEWRDEGSFRHWLFALALNKIRNHRNMALAGKRDVRREQRDADGQLGVAYATMLTPTQELASRDAIARIESAIDGLPESYREVVILSRVVGLGSAQIAERLGKSEGAVRVQLSRALARLAAALQ